VAYRRLHRLGLSARRPRLNGMTEIPHRVGAPARRAFDAAGYRTLEELLAADENELLTLHGVGPKALRIIHEEAEPR
jgi:hypothetical protein